MLIGARTTMFSESGMQTTRLQAYAFYKDNYGYANVGSPNGLSALSFGGWFKLLEPANNGNYMVCGWNQNGGWGSTHISMSSFRFGTGSSSTAFAIQGGNLPVNKWIHCIASYDGQKCRFFRNGVLDSEYDTGQITLSNNDSQFRIASFNEGSVKYSSIGACQTFVLRRGITTEAEAKQLMRSNGVQILEDDSALIEAWKMDSLDSQSFVGVKNLQRLYIFSQTQEIRGPAVEIS